MSNWSIRRRTCPACTQWDWPPEAVYTGELTVPAGSTLDLNGLHLYVVTANIAGTVEGGTVTLISRTTPLPTPLAPVSSPRAR